MGRSVGEYTSKLASYFLTKDKEVEQGYKDCSRMVKLAKQYGNKRFEAACFRLLELASTPTIRSLAILLKNTKQNVTPQPSEPHEKKSYGITRGASYYSKGGSSND